jgi:RHS repeat-associated protein
VGGNGGTDRITYSTWTTSSGSVTGYYAYDVLGRQTTIPGVDTQAGGTTGTPDNVTLTYRSDDLINSLVQGSACETFSYDPSGDVASTSNYASSSCSGTVSTSTNDYAGGSSPAWTTAGSSTTAFFGGITQGNALNVTLAAAASPSCLGISTASCTLNLTDLRGDIVATAALTSGTAAVSGYSETTEFGLPRSASTEASVAPTYGWLGVHEKAANNLSGLVVMGVRIYNPTTGLFTSPDPIYGGNDNAYVYPSDPINLLDLNGEHGGKFHRVSMCALVLIGAAMANCRAQEARGDTKPDEQISRDATEANDKDGPKIRFGESGQNAGGPEPGEFANGASGTRGDIGVAETGGAAVAAGAAGDAAGAAAADEIVDVVIVILFF